MRNRRVTAAFGYVLTGFLCGVLATILALNCGCYRPTYEIHMWGTYTDDGEEIKAAGKSLIEILMEQDKSEPPEHE